MGGLFGMLGLIAQFLIAIKTALFGSEMERYLIESIFKVEDVEDSD